ncbi:unnamed protein product [Malus baccata var. baccata]
MKTQADAWVIENFALVAKYLSTQIMGHGFLMILMLQDIISSAAIKSINRFPNLQGGCWVEFGYTDNAAVYHTKVFFLSFCPIFGILVTKFVFSIGVKFTVGVSKLIS